MKLSTFTVEDKEATGIIEIVRDLSFNQAVFRGQSAVSITPKKDR